MAKKLKDVLSKLENVKLFNEIKAGKEWIPSGSRRLDEALCGGYPKGKIIEIYGDEGLGKSTLSLHFLSHFGGNIAYFDTENSFDPDYAENIGVNKNNLVFCEPETLEQGLDTLIELIPHCEAIVFDTITEAPTLDEVTAEVGNPNVGKKAKVMSQFIRKLKPTHRKYPCTIMFINQVRENPGVMYGSPKTVSGGKALRFATHVRLDLTFGGYLKVGDNDPFGHNIKINIIKNKWGIRGRKCLIPLVYESGKGLSFEQELLDDATGIIEKSGSWYSYGDMKLGQGQLNSRIFLEDNPEITKEILNKLKLQPNGTDKRKSVSL